MEACTKNGNHEWTAEVDSEGTPTGGAHCDTCEVTPQEMIEEDGRVLMPCGHVLREAKHLDKHINWTPIDDGGGAKSCEALMTVCYHTWDAEYDTDNIPTGEVYCTHGCETTPAEAMAADGYLEMPCGHNLTAEDHQEHNLVAHINYSMIGEGTIRTCELDMPGWAD